MIPTGKEDTSRSYSLVDVNTLPPFLYTEVSRNSRWSKVVHAFFLFFLSFRCDWSSFAGIEIIDFKTSYVLTFSLDFNSLEPWSRRGARLRWFVRDARNNVGCFDIRDWYETKQEQFGIYVQLNYIIQLRFEWKASAWRRTKDRLWQ